MLPRPVQRATSNHTPCICGERDARTWTSCHRGPAAVDTDDLPSHPRSIIAEHWRRESNVRTQAL